MLSVVREESIFNHLHSDAAYKLGQLADHALHVQCRKLGFSLAGLAGETERPFNPQRVLLGALLLGAFLWENPNPDSCIQKRILRFFT